MKRSGIFLFSLLALFPAAADADRDSVRISHVLKLSDVRCAVELEITADGDDAFLNEDAVTLDGTTLFTLEGVIDAGINGEDAENDAGDHILAMSSSMTADATVTVDPDLSFDDSHCDSFDGDAVFSFVIDGVAVDTVNAAEMNGFGDGETAIERGGSGTAILVDLDVESVRLFNNAGESQTFGEEDPDASSSAESDSIFDCSLNPAPKAGGDVTPACIVLAAGFATILACRIFAVGERRF